MTTFALRIHASVQAELDAAVSAEAHGDIRAARRHLARAHILGQPATSIHVRVHWRMFRFALRGRQAGEALGQAWRLVGAALFTAAGLVPQGNTGESSVNGFARMPIPEDLQSAIDLARGQRAPRARAPGLWRVAIAATLAIVTALGTLGIGGCSTPPKDLDLSLAKPSAAGRYQVALIPPVEAPAINQMHSWKLQLSTADGRPVHGASFAVDGGMPQHGHGLPTQPRVTRELADGTYQLDGMKFSMTGWWEVKLGIQGPPGADTVTFNTVVKDLGGKP